jgi:nondiscriminating glutamyl-tRNA synthetase
MSKKIEGVRVRFAPSPTGYLHVGGARTAIFNYLFARHHGGTFILRIEDTDVERSTRESEISLLEDLRWLGLDWDEGPDVGGPYGPYRQSERMQTYREITDKLIASRHAYPCFCTEAELERKRKEMEARHEAPHYDGTCRELSAADIAAKRAAKIPEAIRFRVGEGAARFEDAVRGAMDLGHDMVGDWVILRSNGLPTYNFAAAVDDMLMKITHVIRGEEHLPNTLRQIMIYDALAAPHPIFAHVPLILAEDRSKLSKRHGASSVGELRAAGYLPDAATNYLLLLGWSHPQSKEIMPRDEMLKAFSIERIGKSPAVYDKNKLVWMNGQYIRKLDLDTLVKLVEPYMPESLRARYSATERREIVAILQDSLDVLGDFPKRAAIFEPEVEYEPDTKTLLDSDSAKRVLGAMVTRLHAHGGPVTPESFKEMILSAGAEVALKGKDLYFPIRGAMTGSVHGPDLTRVAAVKGRDAVTRLLEGALK